MSLKAGNYKGFVYATGEKIVSIESAVTTLKSDVVDASGVVVAFKEEFQDLSGQVQVLDASMVVVEGRLDGMDASMAAVEGRLDGMDASMAAVEVSVQDLSAEFQDLSGQVNAGGGGVGNVISTFPISRNIQNLNEDVAVEGGDRNPWSLTLSAGTYMFVFTPRAFLLNPGGDIPLWTSETCNCNAITFTLGTRELSFSVYPDLSVPVGNVGYYTKYFGKYTMIFTLETSETMGLITRMSSPVAGVVALDPIQGYLESEIEYVKLA